VTFSGWKREESNPLKQQQSCSGDFRKIGIPPVTHCIENRGKAFSECGQGIFGFRRHDRIDSSGNQTSEGIHYLFFDVLAAAVVWLCKLLGRVNYLRYGMLGRRCVLGGVRCCLQNQSISLKDTGPDGAGIYGTIHIRSVS